LVGIIVIYRQEVRPFTDKQIALVQNFVAQAVIAIENARLLSELRQSLEQQTATADVLRVISSSPGELQPVFEAMLQNAVQICDAKFGNLGLLEGDGFRFVAQHRAPPNYRDARQREPLVRANTRTNLDGVIKTKQVVHVADVAAEEPHSGIATLAGARTLLNVPMLKDDELVGIIAIYRQEVRPFTGKQIDVLQNFAAQAVIAIENARLLNELRESLDRQTATADILRVIASTPEDSKHALDTIAETASRMFDTANVNFRRLEGNVLRMVSAAGPSVTKLREVVPDASLEPTEPAVRCVLENRQIAIEDRQAALPNERGEIGRALHDLALRGLPIRSQAFTPLLRESKAIGVMIVSRGEVQPFQEHELELMKGFADQAVIAIENARLLNELRQSLEQQTATADVLRIISSSPGELGPVFQAMLGNATRLCEANFGNLFLREGNGFRTVAIHSSPSPYTEWYERHPFVEPTKEYPNSTLARLIETKKILHIADLRLDRGYLEGYPPIVALVDGAGARTDLLVPMIKDDQLIGAIVIYRTEVRQFTEKQIELVQNFAAQAVIAIENARLLNDLNKLNQQLEQRVSDQVGEIERMGRLRRFLPPQVADLIIASGAEKQLESHRREITALFCDLRGFTGFSESSDPEDVMALLRDYHAAIGQIIIKYSGTLERYAGDGVMVVFNDPVPVENPALQAVLMALEMRTAIGALTETWHRWGHDIGFGIGIAHGFATLGTIGFEGRFDYAAIGTVSNIASRLCDEAKPGQILINFRVLTKVENAVTVEPVGEFALKGIRRPMMAYNVPKAPTSKLN